MKRLLLAIITLIAIFFGFPWVMFIIYGVYGLTTKESFFELILLGIFTDIMYQSFLHFGSISLPMYSITTLLYVFVILFLRKNIMN